MNELNFIRVQKRYLYVLSGMLWTTAGFILVRYAFNWLDAYMGQSRWLFILSGLLIAGLVHHLGFLKVVDKNLSRIKPMEKRPVIFTFISFKSFLIIIVMMSFGIILRKSSLPREYLSVIYLGIGIALLLSSIRYFRYFVMSFFDTGKKGSGL